MKYRAKLLELINSDDDVDFDEWIAQQPIIEQPDIFRELKQLCEEKLAENGEDIRDVIDDFDTFDEKINVYEEAVLDEKLAEANLVMAQQELDKKMIELNERVAGVRRYVMDCIINNEENAEAMKELAQKLMESEKENEIFNPENWADIL